MEERFEMIKSVEEEAEEQENEEEEQEVAMEEEKLKTIKYKCTV
jgi:hypothetical protein